MVIKNHREAGIKIPDDTLRKIDSANNLKKEKNDHGNLSQGKTILVASMTFKEKKTKNRL